MEVYKFIGRNKVFPDFELKEELILGMILQKRDSL
jgi:hypothetical protein